MTATTRNIGFDLDRGVGFVTLNRPDKLNAMTSDMSAELFGLVERAESDASIRVLVITGSGDRSFSVGSDIAEVDNTPEPWQFRNRRDYCDALRALRIPVVAAVNGYAYGGGLELALSCDIRIASTKASFAAAEIKLGWIGGGGVSALLISNVSAGDAALMLLTGDPIAATEAHRVGLVSRLCEPADLQSTAADIAYRIAERPPIAAQSAKANLLASRSMGLEAAIQYERELQAVCLATSDAAEGRRAFLDKRAPRFTGH
jgi:enoyl-CoA hydratase/carnithine racemase